LLRFVAAKTKQNKKNFHFVCHRRAAEEEKRKIKTSLKNFILFLYVIF